MADEGGSAQLEIRASWTPLGDVGAARRGVGRAHVHGRRPRARPGRGHRSAEPARPTRRAMTRRADGRLGRLGDTPLGSHRRRAGCPGAREGAAPRAARRAAADHRDARGAPRGRRGPRVGHRTARDRRRARLRLPLLRPGLPRPAPPRRGRHRPGRPDRLRRPRPVRPRPSTVRSGSCTPRRRTCRASPRSACGRARSSTPSSPGGCSATPGSVWPPSSRRSSATGSARSTRPSTGRPVRCPSRGSSTPRSTSSRSSSSATPCTEQLVEAGKWGWAEQEFAHLMTVPRGRAPTRAVATYVGAAPGPRSSGAGRGPRPVARPRRDRRASRRHARPDHPRLRDRRGGRRQPPRPRRRCSGCAGSTAGARSATPRRLARRAPRRPASCPTASSRPPQRATTARHRRGPGPRRTRPPRPG